MADRPGHDRRYALDSSKIKAELGWEPQIPLENGIAKTVNWYQANAAWLADIRGGEYLKYYERFYLDRESSLAALVPGTGNFE